MEFLSAHIQNSSLNTVNFLVLSKLYWQRSNIYVELNFKGISLETTLLKVGHVINVSINVKINLIIFLTILFMLYTQRKQNLRNIFRILISDVYSSVFITSSWKHIILYTIISLLDWVNYVKQSVGLYICTYFISMSYRLSEYFSRSNMISFWSCFLFPWLVLTFVYRIL